MTTVLNLGCGWQTSERCVNIDWSLPVRLKSSRLGRRVAPLVLNPGQKAAFAAMRGELRGHDLRTGIPYPDSSVDAVYHSHVLEHIDRVHVPGFLAEVLRVLKPGGVHRVVVPDLERQAREYVASLDASLADPAAAEGHEATVHTMIEQMVRREAYFTSTRPPLRRRLENLLLGDARKRGETHQWMWDRVSLPRELERAGFADPQVVDNRTSRIPDWRGYRLDEDAEGREYKTDSIYVEAVKPG
jgi:SAM-dependent methyltransferase